jgi:hypothetical protein
VHGSLLGTLLARGGRTGAWRRHRSARLTAARRRGAEGAARYHLRLAVDVDGNRRQRQEANCRREQHHDWHGAACRVNPDDGSDLPERRPHPVGGQCDHQLADRQPRADAHPALLGQPAQRCRALGGRQPGQQLHDRGATTAFSLTV